MINVNRGDVEHSLGCDLVYYVHRYDSYVLVQYKRMTRAATVGRGYRPDVRLDDELDRMRGIAAPAAPSDDPNDHRLGESFCFLTLREGEVDEPFSGRLAQGMYIPIDLWDKLDRTGPL